MAKVVTLMLNPSVDVMLEFDEFTKTKTNRVKKQTEKMGGKGLNVSLVAASFGLDVCATGFIGNDKEQELTQILSNAGIKNSFLVVEGKTRTNYKFMDESDKTVTEANCHGFTVDADKLLELERTLDVILADADIFVLTGSIPKGVSTDFYAKCIKKANLKGIKTILDASGEALYKALCEKPYAIKPNIDELSELVGKTLTEEQEIKSAMASLNKQGVNLVAVSMGADGAIFSQDNKTVRGKTFDIEFKSAVGAGDSMVGAICYSVAKKLPIERTARMSIAAGCITTSKPATNLCTAEEVFTNEERVEIL